MTKVQRGICVGVVVMVAGVLLLPAGAWAQTVTSGSIAGVVRDTSGAVLPGATVEAASPALIEKVRAVVADASGQYRIVDLRPGVYTVTFTLPGFGTVIREGIELTTGFTATVNAELRVGGVEETITVTGASPIVDTQNVRTQNVLSHEYLEAVPTGKAATGYASLILGATSSLGPDVGGAKGDASNITVQVHNSRAADNMVMLDGMRYTYQRGAGGGSRGYYLNHLGVTEVVLETSGQSAESETAGIQQNAVPKDGGNTFQLVAIGNYAGSNMGTNNLTDELRARGLTATNSVKQVYDLGLGLGGPLKKDRLWFYTAHRRQVANEYFAGNYFNKTPNTLFYTPDLSRQAYLNIHSRDNSVRLTWQASEKHKITVYESNQRNCQCFYAIHTNKSPEATGNVDFRPNLLQGTWTNPATNRLLFEVGATYGRTPWVYEPVEGVARDSIAVTDLSTGYRYGAGPSSPSILTAYTDFKNDQVNVRASGSYVTGSHAFKAGLFYFVGVPATDDYTYTFQNVAYSLRTPAPGAAPVPVSITLLGLPNRSVTGGWTFGLYAQDQWTLQRLTLNLGVRFDQTHSWVPAFTRPAGQFLPEFSFAKVDNVPNWKDISPRFGAAYDLFGNGKTAIKASIGRYVVAHGTSLAAQNSPANALVTSVSRTWNDANGDYLPQESELGPLSNTAFGTVVQNTTFAPEILEGWRVRPYTWLASAVLQQELGPRLGLSVSYFRSWYDNYTTTDNVRVTPADYSPFCVTAPADSRLPGGGGNQICGQYDINPTAFGAVRNLVTAESHFGKQTEVFNSIEASVSARFGRGGVVNGGAFHGNTVNDKCFVVDSPQALYQCKTDNPSTQFKVNGTYPLPWDLQLGVVYQNLQGIPILANLVYTNAQIAPSLGRNLGSCGTRAVCNGTATVSLVQPNTLFEDRYTQLDIRVTKTFRIGRARWQGMVDAYNVFNNSSITGRNDTFGSAWGRPTQMQLGRLFKVGTQLDW